MSGLSFVDEPPAQAGAPGTRLRRAAGLTLGVALALSGGAGLMNEVLWQRALRKFLGGSEVVSSTIVVVVFLAGLGIGSLVAGRRARRLPSPFAALAAVEAAIAVLALGVAWLLESGATNSLLAAQRLAAASGAPILGVYSVTAVLILLCPCLLMGATMPLAAEACQNRLGSHDARLVGLLYFANTIGAVGGSLGAGIFAIPALGLGRSMRLASAANLAAAALALALSRLLRAGPPSVAQASEPTRLHRNALPAEAVAFALGFCSLGYEMVLFRMLALQDRPFAFTFAAVLSAFLLFWSIGAYLSSMTPAHPLAGAIISCAALLPVGLPFFRVGDPRSSFWSAGDLGSFLLIRGVDFLPCVAFGYAFGKVMAESAKTWGRDVGRVAAWNTVGSCCGAVAMAFVGYDFPLEIPLACLGLLLLATAALAVRRAVGLVPLAACLGLVTFLPRSFGRVDRSTGARSYYGPAGVVTVLRDGTMLWDGLWHAHLSRGGDHVGSRNWLLATAGVLAHGPDPIRRSCVIGLGTGVTAATLAKLGPAHVDVYELNPDLKELLRDYPDGTLHVGENSKVTILWGDARSGLALSDARYDLIVTSPLWLRQSGSALLNSREFYELVRSRLGPGGVFVLYSNGNATQAFAIRQTAAAVFRYGESFSRGYLLVLSDSPLDLSARSLSDKFARSKEDALWAEIAACSATRDPAAVLARVDVPRLAWGDGRLVITDDWPVIEYPEVLDRTVERLGYDVTLLPPE